MLLKDCCPIIPRSHPGIAWAPPLFMEPTPYHPPLTSTTTNSKRWPLSWSCCFLKSFRSIAIRQHKFCSLPCFSSSASLRSWPTMSTGSLCRLVKVRSRRACIFPNGLRKGTNLGPIHTYVVVVVFSQSETMWFMRSARLESVPHTTGHWLMNALPENSHHLKYQTPLLFTF